MSVPPTGADPLTVFSWRMPTSAAVLVSLLVPVLLFVLWAFAAKFHWMSAQLLPAPEAVWEAAQELSSDYLWENVWASIRRLALGVTVGVIAGTLLGGAMGSNRRADTILHPTFLALVQIPTLAWIPLLIMLLGLGEALKIAIIVKAVLIPVVIYTQIGVRNVEPRLLEMALVLRISAWWRVALLILPTSLPSFMIGLRLGLTQAWTSLLVVELLASADGIGFLLVWGRQLFRLDIVFVCIIVIAFVGVVLDWVVHSIDRRIVHWPLPPMDAAPFRLRESGFWEPVTLPVVLVGLWGVAAARGWVEASFLPAPTVVLTALHSGLSDGTMTAALLLSLKRSALGLLIGGGLGFAAGMVVGLFPLCDRLFSGTLTVLRLVAVFSWLPLLMSWTGPGEPAKIAFISIVCFFPMQFATRQGIATLSPQLAETAKALRLGLLVRSICFVLPGAAPSILAGFRIALLHAWTATIGAEYFMTSAGGIGDMLITAQQLFRMDIVLSGMVLSGLITALIGWLGQTVEARAIRWRQT